MKYVSVVTPTIRENNMKQVFENFQRQNYENKELIVILNKDDMVIDNWLSTARKHKNIRIYRMEEGTTLGECRNFGAEVAKYDIIAHFDDDDYYSPNYLTNSIKLFNKVDADIIGKATSFMYLEGRKFLVLYNPNKEFKYVAHVPDATMIYSRRVFNQVKFAPITLGVEIDFQRRCLEAGFKVFSGDKYDFAIFRSVNPDDHTWQEKDKELLRYSKVITAIKSYRHLVVRRSNKQNAQEVKSSQEEDIHSFF